MALFFQRRSSSGTRTGAGIACALLVVILPVAVAADAKHADFDDVLETLLLSCVNAFLALTWGRLAKVPRTDLVGLALLCCASAAIVAVLILQALTLTRLF